MRYVLFVLFVLVSCASSEYGDIEVFVCPPCPEVFSGFERCAFYEVDTQWAREGMLVDADHYAGVGTPVRVAGYMHHKFCFNDTHVVFGSANPTVFGLLISDNLMVRIASETLAENFASEYALLKTGNQGAHTRSFTINDLPVEHVFCPRHGCEQMLLSYIHAAEREIMFLAFSFTSRPIGDALVAAHLRGVHVQGVFDAWGAGSQHSQYHVLASQNISVTRYRPAQGVMHHKAFIVDDTVIIGSFNPSANANTRNAETLVALADPDVLAAVRAEFVRIAQ